MYFTFISVHHIFKYFYVKVLNVIKFNIKFAYFIYLKNIYLNLFKK